MEEFINKALKPTDTCIVCTEYFDAKHIPVALSCSHIFGYECIKKWLRGGSGNTKSCPFCRHVVMEEASDPAAFNTASIWTALCAQPPTRIHRFLLDLWDRTQRLCRGRFSAHFATLELLENLALPALAQEGAGRDADPFQDSHDLIDATWNSVGRPDTAIGLAVPLVRLARLMSQSSSILPKWLTSVQRMNLLFWRANQCLGLTEDRINWSHIMEAAKLDDRRLFPLLHLYTVLISQSIAHVEPPREWPKRRHEVMNLVIDRCCRRIGGDWRGKPSNEFKDVLVVVFGELKRHQVEHCRVSLRGHTGEEHVVTGLWGLATWRRVGAPRPVRPRSPLACGSCDSP